MVGFIALSILPRVKFSKISDREGSGQCNCFSTEDRKLTNWKREGIILNQYFFMESYV